MECIHADFTKALAKYACFDYLSAKSVCFAQAMLSETSWENARLREAQFVQVDLYRANLHNCDLARANLTRANLRFADLRGANLEAADLTGADLSHADLTSANLSKAILKGVTCEKVRLDGVNLEGAIWDQGTTAGKVFVRAARANGGVKASLEKRFLDLKSRDERRRWLRRVAVICAAPFILISVLVFGLPLIVAFFANPSLTSSAVAISLVVALLAVGIFVIMPGVTCRGFRTLYLVGRWLYFNLDGLMCEEESPASDGEGAP